MAAVARAQAARDRGLILAKAVRVSTADCELILCALGSLATPEIRREAARRLRVALHGEEPHACFADVHCTPGRTWTCPHCVTTWHRDAATHAVTVVARPGGL